MGVSRTASTQKIREEYRRLAKKYHPDFNRGNKRIEQLFKEVNEAREVLCDREKRAQYDRFGKYEQQRFGRTSSRVRVNANFGQHRQQATNRSSNPEVFKNFVGAFGGRASNVSSASNMSSSYVEIPISLTFSQAFHGTEQKLQLNNKTTTIRIPPGVKHGSRIGLNRENYNTRQQKDLCLKISVQPHPVFKLQGNNIVCKVCITPIEAILGTEITVPTVNGSASVKIPSGVNSEQSLRLKDRGWQSSSGERGDQIIMLKIVTPKKLSTAERELYEKLRQISNFNPRQII